MFRIQPQRARPILRAMQQRAQARMQTVRHSNLVTNSAKVAQARNGGCQSCKQAMQRMYRATVIR